MLKGSEASITIEKCSIPEMLLDKVPYTLKLNTLTAEGTENVSLCVFFFEPCPQLY